MIENGKLSLPVLPAKSYWAIREKFIQSIPPKITKSYLGLSLGMSENSASKNILPALKALGLVADDLTPTDRINKWRDDSTYKNVCEEMLKEAYPSELLHAQPAPNPDRNAVDRWIAQKTGLGQNAVQQRTALYLLLCEADLEKGKGLVKKLSPKANKDKPVKKVFVNKTDKSIDKNNQQNNASISAPTSSVPNTTELNSNIVHPSIHIDIQIHISPEAKNEQIESIFKNMSKYIFRNKE
jgi:hypothetical protein